MLASYFLSLLDVTGMEYQTVRLSMLSTYENDKHKPVSEGVKQVFTKYLLGSGRTCPSTLSVSKFKIHTSSMTFTLRYMVYIVIKSILWAVESIFKLLNSYQSAALLLSGCNVILIHPVSHSASDEDAIVFQNHKYNHKLYIFVYWQSWDGQRSWPQPALEIFWAQVDESAAC